MSIPRSSAPLRRFAPFVLAGALAGAMACAGGATPAPATTATPAPPPAAAAAPSDSAPADPLTPAGAAAFMERAERELAALSEEAGRASWVAATFITHDTEILSAQAQTAFAVAVQRLATEAARFDDLQLAPTLRRKFDLLKLALAAPPPADSARAAELTRLVVGLEADYGKGQYCRPAGAPGNDTGREQCLGITQLGLIMAQSRNPAELKDVWEGWHRIGAPMKDRYARFVELSNEGARGLGFANTGAMWRAGYDMEPDAFAAELDRLWEQVRPLYLSLHAYVRDALIEKYGDAARTDDGTIPAQLLGNMWAQEWGNVFDVVAPAGAGDAVDVTALLEKKGVDELEMVRYGERFFTSLGFDPLPETFWERSQFVQPTDHEAVCHASAWNIDNEEDVRIKMCITRTADDFVTVHHELGHNFYQRAYRNQPFLFRNGANDGFHEAVGDAVALSITPEYLKQVGLLDVVPAANDTALLLRQALDKVAFLPFGLLIDQWRWKVFSGEITPAGYNDAWWEMRERYQGVSAPVARPAGAFDPGAKFHVPANTPYTRYFLARVLQFQFYRAMCREAGYTGPLHRCSFFGSEEAGAKLAAMLEAGQSRPWQETLYALTGERTMDAGAMAEYFAPLKAWLDARNQGKRLGWEVGPGR
ncbi:MAG TPA: M2 family metallopeptidase [Gemmatimonadales bacterium]